MEVGCLGWTFWLFSWLHIRSGGNSPIIDHVGRVYIVCDMRRRRLCRGMIGNHTNVIQKEADGQTHSTSYIILSCHVI